MNSEHKVSTVNPSKKILSLEQLNQLFYLNREVLLLEKKLEETVSAMQTSAVHTVTKHEIDTLKAVIRKRKKQIARIDRYIQNIPEPHIRIIFVLRYEKGLNWLQVAMRLGGVNNADNVRQIAYRYLKKYREQ